MGTNQDYKNRALASLDGKWTDAAVVTLIVCAISMCLNIFGSEMMSSLWWLFCLPLDWGLVVFFLSLARREHTTYNNLFDGYKDLVRILVTKLLVTLCVCLGFALLIVPGVILALMLSQTDFIMKDDKQIGYLDAMQKSIDMMKGHKMEYFWLILSFIGWAILACLTAGLGFLLFIPYWNTTAAHFYEDLKAEQNG